MSTNPSRLNHRNQPPKAEIVDGGLVISVGVEDLATVLSVIVRDWNGGTLIDDIDEAAQSIAFCIARYDDDGIEPLWSAYNRAAGQAVRDEMPEFKRDLGALAAAANAREEEVKRRIEHWEDWQ